MHEVTPPKLAKWPFIASDVIMVATAAFVVSQGRGPLTIWEAVVCTGAVALGAVLGVTPFVFEYRALLNLSQTVSLAETLQQLRNLEGVARNVSASTAQWQSIQDQAAQSARMAKQIGDQMAGEATAFTEFLKKANDSEKATLRLEVEKLHRAQGDWLQVVVRTLDHVHALHRAAVQSDRPEVAAQIGGFQDACRDIARRVGLVPFEAVTNETFDSSRHRALDESVQQEGARVAETIAPGYTFQGQPVRPALVKLRAADSTESPAPESPTSDRQPAVMEQALL